MTYISFLILSFILPFLHLTITELEDETEVEPAPPGTYQANDQCNYTLVAPKKIINPYKADLINFVPQKPFGSVHLKCAACLAVANQISRIIENIIRKSETKQICQYNKDLSNKVNELCTKGFKNYDLRQCNDFNLVTDQFTCTEHVKSNMDGGWTKKLRELCILYTSHMDLDYVGNIYANNTEELSTHLCRGTGIFRDCKNLEFGPQKDLGELCEKCSCLNKCL